MDKGEIITQVIIWGITTTLSAFLGWIFGKKKSKDAVGRKGSIYLPLVEELENINSSGLSVSVLKLSYPVIKLITSFVNKLLTSLSFDTMAFGAGIICPVLYLRE